MISTKDFTEKQIVFVFLNHGECVNFNNDNIVVRDKDNRIKFQTTCYLLFALFLIGNHTLTTGVLDKSKKFGFSIILMTQNFRTIYCLPSRAEGNVLLRRKQYAHQGFELGSWIISNKIVNQRQTLSEIRNKNDELKAVIHNLSLYQFQVLQCTNDCHQIMGYEGAAAKAYFSQMYNDYAWTARLPRVKHDMTNCLLDIGYTMLFNFVNALLEMYGFDTYVGILHREFFQRKSLTCDLVEPFRPIIDKSIRKSLNLGKVKEDDFCYNQHQYSLFGKQAIPYIQTLTESLLERKDEIFLFIQKYYRSFIRSQSVNEFPHFLI